MAIYRVTAFGDYFAQTIINKFDYVSSGAVPTAGGAATLSEALTGGVGDPIWDGTGNWSLWLFGVSAAYNLREVQVLNLYDPLDFFVQPIPIGIGVGQLPDTDSQPPFMAYGFRTNRVRSDIRRGQRRIVGARELDVGPFGVLAGATITRNIGMATRFSDPIEVTTAAGVTVYTPAVLSFDDYTTPSGRTAYRKYPTEAEQLENAAVGVVWSALGSATTQNSRKVGRGI